MNSCHSMALGEHFIAAGVRHVVCVRDESEVRDESCRLFARDFFGALRAGRSVQEAFGCGSAVLSYSQEPHLRKDAGAFALLPPNACHDEALVPAGGATRAARPAPPEGGAWGNIPPVVEDFVGREADIHRLIMQLRARRFVELHGEAGVGKSTLLAEAGRFLFRRPARESFEEVRWVNLEEDDGCSEDCSVGLANLKRRLNGAPGRRLLLMVDGCATSSWALLRPLLRFGGVHLALASESPAIAAESDMGAGSCVGALAAGLKPVVFPLGPLEPIAQARLFLRRAPRPLYACELSGGPAQLGGPAAKGEILLAPPRRPAELLAIAEASWLCTLGGNPARIVAAAQMLGPAKAAGRSDAADASAQAHCDAAGELSPTSAAEQVVSMRRVRLVRPPDGLTKDVWFSLTTSIADVLKAHRPKALLGNVDIFVEGCLAPQDAVLGAFPDNVEQGFLALEFREKQEQEDW